MSCLSVCHLTLQTSSEFILYGRYICQDMSTYVKVSARDTDDVPGMTDFDATLGWRLRKPTYQTTHMSKVQGGGSPPA